MKSAAFPMVKSRPMTSDEAARSKARFDELDARHRLYVTEAETAALMGSGLVCDFGGGLVWLKPNPSDLGAFNLLIKMRTDEALSATPAEVAAST